MESLPHYGPWDGAMPQAELTSEEETRMKKVTDELFNPTPEQQKEFFDKWKAAFEDFERRKKLPPEEQEREIREFYEKHPICYSPPFMPIDPIYRKLWEVLLSVGIMDVQIVKENGKTGVVFHKPQTVTLEAEKFYPFESCGGEEQQKAFGKS